MKIQQTAHGSGIAAFERLFFPIAIFLTCVLLAPAAAGETDAPSTLKIAGLQMNVSPDMGRNKSRILDGIRKAAKEGTQFLVTPEGSLSGYKQEFDREELLDALKKERDR